MLNWGLINGSSRPQLPGGRKAEEAKSKRGFSLAGAALWGRDGEKPPPQNGDPPIGTPIMTPHRDTPYRDPPIGTPIITPHRDPPIGTPILNPNRDPLL